MRTLRLPRVEAVLGATTSVRTLLGLTLPWRTDDVAFTAVGLAFEGSTTSVRTDDVAFTAVALAFEGSTTSVRTDDVAFTAVALAFEGSTTSVRTDDVALTAVALAFEGSTTSVRTDDVAFKAVALAFEGSTTSVRTLRVVTLALAGATTSVRTLSGRTLPMRTDEVNAVEGVTGALAPPPLHAGRATMAARTPRRARLARFILSPDVSLCIGTSEDSLTDIGIGTGELNQTCTVFFFGLLMKEIGPPNGPAQRKDQSASADTRTW
jgi:hypothetical protein